MEYVQPWHILPLPRLQFEIRFHLRIFNPFHPQTPSVPDLAHGGDEDHDDDDCNRTETKAEAVTRASFICGAAHSGFTSSTGPRVLSPTHSPHHSPFTTHQPFTPPASNFFRQCAVTAHPGTTVPWLSRNSSTRTESTFSSGGSSTLSGRACPIFTFPVPQITSACRYLPHRVISLCAPESQFSHCFSSGEWVHAWDLDRIAILETTTVFLLSLCADAVWQIPS